VLRALGSQASIGKPNAAAPRNAPRSRLVAIRPLASADVPAST
jgi:hypothetical protein